MIDALLVASGDLNDPCCPDFTKHVCFRCRRNITARLAILAHNIAIGAALGEAWLLGSIDFDPWPPVDVETMEEA